MGMGTSAAVVDGQYMLYYLGVSMWSWRGMVELGSLLADYPCDRADFNKTSCKKGAALSATLLKEAASFKSDINAAVARSAVVFTPEERQASHGLAAAIPMENPYCSCRLTRRSARRTAPLRSCRRRWSRRAPSRPRTPR